MIHVEKARKKLSSFFVNIQTVIELYEEGVNELKIKGGEEELPVVCRELSELYIKTNDYRKAAHIIVDHNPHLAIEYYLKCGNFRKAAEIKKQQAVKLFNEKNYLESLIHIDDCIRYYKLITTKLNKDMLELKAECYFWMEEYENSLQSYNDLAKYLSTNKLLRWNCSIVLQKCCLLNKLLGKDIDIEYDEMCPYFKNSSEYRNLMNFFEKREVFSSSDKVQKKLFEMVRDIYFMDHPQEELDYYRGFVVGLGYGLKRNSGIAE